MALIDCRECKDQVSNEAPTCPKCGVPTPGKIAREKKEVTDKSGLAMFIVTIVFIILISIIAQML